jgi:hypothetical protein
MTKLFPVLLVLCGTSMSYVVCRMCHDDAEWPYRYSGKLINCMIHLYISNHASIRLIVYAGVSGTSSDDRCVDQHSTYQVSYKYVVVVQVYSLDSRHLISNTGLPAAP